jgi:hypothetical protein
MAKKYNPKFSSSSVNSLQSLFEKAGHDGYNDTDNYHGCDGEVYFQVGPVNDNITRETPYGEFPEPRPKKPHNQEYQTQQDQRFLHDTLHHRAKAMAPYP